MTNPGKELHSSIREIAVLQEATEMILGSSDADTVLHQILLIVRNYFGITRCAVFMVDAAAGELHRRAHNGHGDSDGKLSLKIGREGVAGRVAETKAPMYVPDVSKELRYIVTDSRICSELALPMIVRDEVIAVLDLESDKLDHFTDDMIGLLAVFAGQAAVALDNARLYTNERRRMRQIEFVNLIAKSAANATEVKNLVGNLVELIGDTFEGSEASILLRDGHGDLTLEAHSGNTRPQLERFQQSARSGVVAEAMAAKMNVHVNDVLHRAATSAGTHATLPERWTACIESSKSELAVPLMSISEMLGVVVVSNPEANAFSAEDCSIAQVAGDVCATAIRNVQMGEELRRVANTDSLTGIYNQRYFHVAVAQEISRAKRFAKAFALMMFDLRNFREINQNRGFDQGDEVLRAVAKVIGSSVRSIDTVCRYSSDHFAIVLPEVQRPQVQAVRKKLETGLLKVGASNGDHGLSLSALFAEVYFPDDGATELELIRQLLNRIEKQKA